MEINLDVIQPVSPPIYSLVYFIYTVAGASYRYDEVTIMQIRPIFN